MNPAAIYNLLRATPLSPVIYGLIATIVRAIIASPDPLRAAKRAAMAAATKEATNKGIDEILARRAQPKGPAK